MKSLRTWLAGSLLVGLALVPAAQAAIITKLQPTVDLYINPVESPGAVGVNGDVYNTNPANDQRIDSTILQIGNPGGALGPDRRAFLKFDVSPAQFLSYAPIQSVQLRLYMEDLGAFDQYANAQVRRVQSDWTAGSVTYAQGSASTTTHLGNFATATGPAPNQYYTIDITSTGKDWHSGALPNYGLALKVDSEGFTGTGRQFTSSSGAVLQRPELVFTQQTVWTPSADVYVTPNATPAFNGQSGDVYNAADPQGTSDDVITNNTQLLVGHNNNDAAGDHRAFLKFDVSNITGGSGVVESATLRLRLDSTQPYGVVSVHEVAAAWNEGAVLYSQPVGGLVGTLAANGGGAIPPALGWHELDLTSLVQQWVDDPSGNLGLRLSQVEGFQGTYRVFSSSAGANGPQLVIQFATVPEPSTWLLVAAGGLALLLVGRRRRLGSV